MISNYLFIELLLMIKNPQNAGLWNLYDVVGEFDSSLLKKISEDLFEPRDVYFAFEWHDRVTDLMHQLNLVYFRSRYRRMRNKSVRARIVYRRSEFLLVRLSSRLHRHRLPHRFVTIEIGFISNQINYIIKQPTFYMSAWRAISHPQPTESHVQRRQVRPNIFVSS